MMNQLAFIVLISGLAIIALFGFVLLIVCIASSRESKRDEEWDDIEVPMR